MNRIQELRAKLKKLNGLQWTKKQFLKNVIYNNGACQRSIHKNMVMSPEGHPGAKYVPWDAAKYLSRQNKAISELTKDLNKRKRQINQLESEIFQIQMAMSKDTYFEIPGELYIMGVHSVGFKGPEGQFYQEEIWANNYEKETDGTLKMRGGSMRVHGSFDAVVMDIVAGGGIQVEGKLK